MEIINHRGGLERFRKAINDKNSVRIGYIGGSITAEGAKLNWPEFVNAWLKEVAPDKIVYAENISIGGTGSDIGIFGFDSQLACKDCDLIFVEFAVNDEDKDHELRARSREGLVRKILSKSDADIVFVYTYTQYMLEDMLAGRVPVSIADFEKIAEHYNIGSVWMAKAAFEYSKKGYMGFENFLRDGLHPNQLGSSVYASAVIEYLSQELKLTSKAINRDTASLNPYNWENASVVPFEDIKTDGCWYVRSLFNDYFGHALYTSSLDAVATIKCKCRTMVICRLYGTQCGMLKYRIDGGEWLTLKRDVLGWMGGSNWPFLSVLIDENEEAEHTVELMSEKTARECGSSLYITYVGIV